MPDMTTPVIDACSELRTVISEMHNAVLKAAELVDSRPGLAMFNLSVAFDLASYKVDKIEETLHDVVDQAHKM